MFTTAKATHTHHRMSGGISRKVVVPSAAVFQACLAAGAGPRAGQAGRLARSAGTGPAAPLGGAGSGGDRAGHGLRRRQGARGWCLPRRALILL